VAYISDGGVQEEASQGVGRLAGHLGLANLVMFYDSNDVQLFRLHDLGITAVAQPVNKIAETITGLVTSRISEEGALHAPHTIMLGCEIILRGSTARPAVSPPP
jgi:hypothetical protein